MVKELRRNFLLERKGRHSRLHENQTMHPKGKEKREKKGKIKKKSVKKVTHPM